MDNRINIDQIILNARKENQTKYIIISAIGIVLPFALWVFCLTKLEPLKPKDIFNNRNYCSYDTFLNFWSC